MSSERRTKRAAYHEAGHAVVALMFGRRVRGVHVIPLVPPGRKKILGQCDVDFVHVDRRNNFAFWADAVVRFAGGLAEARISHRGPPSYAMGGSYGDYLSVWTDMEVIYAGTVGGPVPVAVYRRLEGLSGAAVKAAWPAIEAVAGQLLARGRLTGRDLKAIVRDSLTVYPFQPLGKLAGKRKNSRRRGGRPAKNC